MRNTAKLFSTFAALASTAVVAAALVFGAVGASAQEGLTIPAPAVDEAPSTAAKETAIFAGGCFWGVQGVFQRVEGVTNAVSGYAGGDKQSAVYETVSGGKTGHAESVRITFDPKKVSYGHLLQIYFSAAHDPTQLNRQGPDVGTQYRSTIFPATERQAALAKAYIEQLDQAKAFPAKIATTIELAQTFYPAEAYHQDYMTLHPRQPYIVMHDLPKVENLKRLFPASWRTDPALVSRTGM